jgi:serine/threonine protein kinase
VKEIKIDLDEDRHEVAEHWNDEVRALLEMNRLGQDHIVRFITAFRHGKQEDPEHFLVFEWASGGNLQDLWKEFPHPARTVGLTKAVIEQLLGLAKALNAAHNLSPTTSYRHGDLKPANILWFRTDNEIGTLKIGDWGEAKVHFVSTEARRSNTSAKFGTRRYEPPEVEIGTKLGDTLQAERTGHKRRSRLYDLWAMGCISLEFMIWLLYGQEELIRFNDEVQGEYNNNSPFYQIKKNGNTNFAEVHRVVVHWLQHMLSDSACRPGTTALGDVLEIIEQGLLVVDLPQTGGRSMSFGKSFVTSSLQLPDQAIGFDADESVKILLSQGQAVVVNEPFTDAPSIKLTPAEPTAVVVQPEPRPMQAPTARVRILAEDLQIRLEQVFLTSEDKYWYSEQQHSRGPPKLGEPPASLSIRTIPGERRSGGLYLKTPAQVDYAHPPLNPAVWTHEIDNSFVSDSLLRLNSLSLSPTFDPQDTSLICERCTALGESLWQPSSPPAYPTSSLQANATARICKLCCLLWSTCVQDISQLPPELHFRKSGSSLKRNDRKLPVLSILRRSSRFT